MGDIFKDLLLFFKISLTIQKKYRGLLNPKYINSNQVLIDRADDHWINLQNLQTHYESDVNQGSIYYLASVGSYSKRWAKIIWVSMLTQQCQKCLGPSKSLYQWIVISIVLFWRRTLGIFLVYTYCTVTGGISQELGQHFRQWILSTKIGSYQGTEKEIIEKQIPWLSHFYTIMSRKVLIVLCAELSFQGCFYSKQPLKVRVIYPSIAESIFVQKP